MQAGQQRSLFLLSSAHQLLTLRPPSPMSATCHRASPSPHLACGPGGNGESGGSGRWEGPAAAGGGQALKH